MSSSRCNPAVTGEKRFSPATQKFEPAKVVKEGTLWAKRAAKMRLELRSSEGLKLTEVKVVNGVNVIAQSVEGLDADALLDLSDRFKQRNAPAAVVLGSSEDGKVHLVANFDQSVADRVSASDVVRAAAALVGGGGGGRPTMARAGGSDAAKLPDALAEAERLIASALSA